jgi:hypothetical protein
VADVRSDPDFGPHREIAAAGFRAVQSTPLTGYADRQIGVVSTHFRRPRRPSVRDLQLMELYADFAGEEAGDLTPFAAVTWFTADTTLQAPPGSDRAAVTALIDGLVTSENLLYAVRITGKFGEIRTRTVREQKPPYPPLTQATQGQRPWSPTAMLSSWEFPRIGEIPRVLGFKSPLGHIYKPLACTPLFLSL